MVFLGFSYDKVRAMKTLRISLQLFSFIFIILITSGCEPEHSNRLYQKISPYSFDDTLENLDLAISEHNYRIIHRSHIGQAIRDRGDTDFPLSTIINFCNITYAKEMLQIDQQLINDMPCFIAVSEQEGNIIVSTKLMTNVPNNKAQISFASKINQNLIDIINAAIE